MKRTLIMVWLIANVFSMYSQIHANEKLRYVASYNMAGLMTQLAQVTMQTEEVKTSKKTYLHLSVEAATFSKWDRFFKIRDLYEAYVEPSNLKPVLYKRNITEGKYQKTEKYVFSGRTVTATTNKVPNEVKSTFSIASSTTDAVSIIYKLRTVDFSNFKSGQTVSFTIAFDQKEYPVSIKFLGTETIKAGCLGSKPCYKLSVSAKTNKLKGKDKNLIWLTADNQKIPVLIRFSIPVGTGQLLLTNASGI